MDVFRSHPGCIEVITGSMFSGKSEELIRRLRRAQIARQRVQIYKPLIDERYSRDRIVSHSDMRIDAELVERADEILEKLDHRTGSALIHPSPGVPIPVLSYPPASPH